MRVRSKKKNSKGIARIETSGELKEVIIKQDIFDSDNDLIEVCFRGEDSSGIVELSMTDLEKINAELNKIKKVNSKNIKVIKFKKSK